MFNDFDRACMKNAFALARRAAGCTSPNPMVGAVLAKDGNIIGRGWHRRAGAAHAEEEAIVQACGGGADGGGRALSAAGTAQGATLYCTLEPCCYTAPDKKRPPCAELIIKNGITRAVIAAEDPNPRVSGGGIAALRRAGIVVETGLFAEMDEELNRGFRTYQRLGRPFVHLKIAASMDGRIASKGSGGKKTAETITGAAARRQVHALRAFYDAVLVGRGCLAADDPRLTVRHTRGRNPLRVLLDSNLTVEKNALILGDSPEEAAKTLVFCAVTADAARMAALRERGVTVIPLTRETEGLSLRQALDVLGERGVRSVLVEGGAAVFGSFFREGLWDRLSVYIAPLVLGEGIPAVTGYAPLSARDALHPANMRIKRVGGDVLLEANREE